MKNFVIVGTQRTGSSALGEMIGLHPEVTCGWEWTQNRAFTRLLTIADKALSGDFSVLAQKHQDHMARVHHDGKTWLGFRRLFRSSDKWLGHPRLAPALLVDQLEAHLQWFARHPDIHVIHIVRCDNIEWLKSKTLSRITNAYWGSEYNPDIKVAINIREAVKRLTAKNWVDQRLATLQQSNPYLRIIYEEFSDNTKDENARILDFMKLAADETALDKRSAKKQSTQPAAEYITNFSALTLELEKRNLMTAEICQK